MVRVKKTPKKICKNDHEASTSETPHFQNYEGSTRPSTSQQQPHFFPIQHAQQQVQDQSQQPHQEQGDLQSQGVMQAMQELVKLRPKPPVKRLPNPEEVIAIDDDEKPSSPAPQPRQELFDLNFALVEKPDSDQEMNEGEEDEFVEVNLTQLEVDLTCPICLDLLRETRAGMACLHRFCKECIEKLMLKGYRNCPVCRMHLPSRRYLREDSRFDQIIAALYPDINHTQKESTKLNDEEKRCNEQIQASISEAFQRQTRAFSTPTASGSSPISSGRRQLERKSARGSGRRGRGRRNLNNTSSINNDYQGSVNDEDEDVIIESSSVSQPCLRLDSNNDTINHNGGIVQRSGTSVGIPEIRTWGKAGQRSHLRRDSRNEKVERESNFETRQEQLQSMRQLEVNVARSSLDVHTMPPLTHLYVSCPTTVIVKDLRKDIAGELGVPFGQVALSVIINPVFPNSGTSEPVYDPSQGSSLRLLKPTETVQELLPYISTQGSLVLGYKRKPS